MDLDLDNHKYRTGRLSPLVQFHIARRLAPILFSLAEAGTKIKEAVPPEAIDAADEADSAGRQAPANVAAAIEDAMFAGFTPVVDALSKMSDADVEYVLNSCLDVTTRQEATGWAPVRVKAGILYQDMNIMVLMRIASAVIQENIGNFLPGQQPASSGATVLPITR